MQQTPIEKAISELKGQLKYHKKNDNRPLIVTTIENNIIFLKSLLPYEKQYLRDVAEKAIDWASENYDERRMGVERVDKNKYLTQNYPS